MSETLKEIPTQANIQLWTFAYVLLGPVLLLNKPYENEVALREQTSEKIR